MSLRCTSRIEIRRPDGLRQLVPCGHCLNCSVRRQMAWSLRLLLEGHSHVFASFLTLTYAEHSLKARLDKRDVQTFLKRYRESFGPARYFCVGEYGSRTGRPHWHMILFSSVMRWLPGVHDLKQWPHGGVHVGDVTLASIAYTARYSLKTGPKGGSYVVLMSRRPGLGRTRLEEIASYLASVQPRIEFVPHWWRVGTRMLPLDKTARDWFLRAYEASGGLVERRDHSPLALDLESRLVALWGDPLADPLDAFRLQELDRRTLENGKA